MKRTTITSVCECQAKLCAELNEDRHVIRGWVATGRGAETSPAHSIGAENPEFHVGWLCPRCGRNTLRSFQSEALSWETIDERVCS